MLQENNCRCTVCKLCTFWNAFPREIWDCKKSNSISKIRERERERGGGGERGGGERERGAGITELSHVYLRVQRRLKQTSPTVMCLVFYFFLREKKRKQTAEHWINQLCYNTWDYHDTRQQNMQDFGLLPLFLSLLTSKQWGIKMFTIRSFFFLILFEVTLVNRRVVSNEVITGTEILRGWVSFTRLV